MLVLALLVLPQAAYAQEGCDDALTQANNSFLFGRFDEASSRLESCLKQDAFSEADKLEVYELLVRIYDAKELKEKVEETLAQLLALVPNYEPDSEDSPRFIQLVKAFKEQVAQVAEETDEADEAPPPVGEEEAPPVEEEAEPQEEEALPAEEEETPEEEAATPEPQQQPAEEEETPPTEMLGPPPIQVTPAAVQGDGVVNVGLTQDGDRLIVSYDLEGSAKKYKVRLLLSNDSGQSFAIIPTAVQGDVGKGIRPGNAKQMVWAVLDDFPAGLDGDQYRVQVDPQKQSNAGLLYVLGGAVVAGVAGTVALVAGGGSDGGGGGGGPEPPTGAIPLPPGRVGGN